MDFPYSANCSEPWKIEVSENIIGDGLTGEGGSTRLLIDVYNWVGMESHHAPVVECPDLFTGTQVANFLYEEGKCSRWEVIISNEHLAQKGSYDVLVSVEDVGNAQSPDYLDLTAYFTHQTHVISDGWAQTWGGTWEDIGYSVAVDASGNVYIAGLFSETIDFKPDGGDPHTSNGGGDIFLTKYDSDGSYKWTRTWGCPHTSIDDKALGVASDPSGNIVLTGCYFQPIDFDPDGGDPRTTNGFTDIFLTKYDPDGNYLWTRTWGSNEYEQGEGIATDPSDNIFLTGSFRSTIDFNPDGGDPHTSNGEADVFLTKYNADGSYQWTRTWGCSGFLGYGKDIGEGVSSDPSGNIYVTGYFQNTVDFDPDGGDPRISSGKFDVFLVKYGTDGNYIWTRTWGGPEPDRGYALSVDPSGNIVVTGEFEGTVDFNPDGGDPHTSNGEWDVYLTKYASDGSYIWTRTWGGPGGNDCGYGTSFDQSGNIVVTGKFIHTVDFNPDGGDSHTSINSDDGFLAKYDPDGNYEWTMVWGSYWGDYGYGISTDPECNILVTGSFGADEIDFKPGGGDPRYNNGQEDAYVVKYLPDGTW